MFDIGFVELVICSIIALLVLGPERLPAAARATGRWIGGARRMVTQFTSELDRQLKAEELREELRKAGDVGLDDVQKTVSDALSEARRYEHMIVSDDDNKLAPPQTQANVSPADNNSQNQPEPEKAEASSQPPQSSPESRP
ncbi:MAG TPA: twin-arginine translocase subunit TatB [Marinobacter sp.]|jgi:sec-independent protein translocase protein TatB|uniref:Sec-independent protein translocase protein TatB n=1 Tax=Marinobacter sp. TaxID=50741 RepID=UPI000EEFE8AA|nr:Sec-independent protein translocase protein TatB [Marinobacter sp.]MBC7192731.1 twin-arginine translocase subunit TatB [Marinobacter sp.]HCW89144.1 twin-arginine translocase subunit TatB [Marinobacter sp.]